MSGVDDTDRRDRHRRTRARHVAGGDHAWRIAVAQLRGSVQNGGEEAPDLLPENLLVLAHPFGRPGIGVGISTCCDQRVRDQVAHDGVVGPVTLEGLDPAELLLNLFGLEILRRCSHRVADDTEGEAGERPEFELFRLQHGRFSRDHILRGRIDYY